SLSGSMAPRSFIVMELPAGSALPLSSEELAVFKDAPKELPFINVHRFLDRIGVGVPKLYAHWPADGVLFLEDLGDTSLWDRVQGTTEAQTFDWYRKAIDELLKVQVHGTAARDESCIAFQQRFDRKLYLWEFEHFIEWGLLKRPGVAIEDNTIVTLRKIFAGIAATLDQEPPCLNHRDFHSWNLMIRDDAVRVIDFQDALLAPAQYDLASLLNDRITDSVITADLEEALIDYYIKRKSALDVDAIAPDSFGEIYRLSAIQRDLKVIGRFYYLDLVKGKPGYKQFIPPTVRRLRKNFPLTAQTKELLPLLESYLEGML
ncbi:MAG: aminoglycoside phosphotransferase family protein, partial [Candidatus Binatia bacterium]